MKNHIEMRLTDGATLNDIKADVMQTAINAALVACRGNQTAASELLGINRWTLRKWLNDASKRTYKPFEQAALCRWYQYSKGNACRGLHGGCQSIHVNQQQRDHDRISIGVPAQHR